MCFLQGELGRLPVKQKQVPVVAPSLQNRCFYSLQSSLQLKFTFYQCLHKTFSITLNCATKPYVSKKQEKKMASYYFKSKVETEHAIARQYAKIAMHTVITPAPYRNECFTLFVFKYMQRQTTEYRVRRKY